MTRIPRQRDPPPTGRAGMFGLPAATALVMGNIIGVGVFALPSQVAVYGTISLVAFAVVAIGGMALAVVFGRLAGREPQTGGPYVYARSAFGEFPGFLNAWSYWITAWISNAALVAGWIGYVDVLLPVRHSAALTIAVGVGAMVTAAAINITGLRCAGLTTVITTTLKFVPLLLVATVGLLFIEAGNFGPFYTGATSWWAALSAAAGLLLFTFLGVESAAVSAGCVRDPSRNVLRATVLGTSAAALVYLLGTAVVFGTVPYGQLVDSAAPFVDAVNNMLGPGAGTVLAVVAVIAGFGTLTGWTLICAQMPYAAARDGLFPAVFLRRSGGVPWVGIAVSTALAATVYATTVSGQGLHAALTTLTVLTTFTATIPYLFSAAAQLLWLVTGRQPVSGRRLAVDLTVAGAAFAFAMWMAASASKTSIYQGFLALLAGIPVYIGMKAAARRAAKPAAGDAPTPTVTQKTI